ncbi:MAG TPA: hypothetical protein VFL92_06560, partial [Sphingomonas sp.]|nr:hypothetical protein [Sphingomonas sp.]
RWLDAVLKRYAAKVRNERHLRRSGHVVAADYTLRQLTHIELILDIGGRSQAMIETLTTVLGEDGRRKELYASPFSEYADTLRRLAWHDAGEPERPPLDFPEHAPHTAMTGGPDHAERDAARREAEEAMAAAQAKWEAAARPDSWAEWKQAHGIGEAT